MHTPEDFLPLGTFVAVGDSCGVVIGWPNGNNIPDDHYAVWYGEMSTENRPRCRIVPIEYCVPCSKIEYYH